MKITLQINSDTLLKKIAPFQAFILLSACRTLEGWSLTLPPSPIHYVPKPYLASYFRAHCTVGKAEGILFFVFDQSNYTLLEVSFPFKHMA